MVLWRRFHVRLLSSLWSPTPLYDPSSSYIQNPRQSRMFDRRASIRTDRPKIFLWEALLPCFATIRTCPICRTAGKSPTFFWASAFLSLPWWISSWEPSIHRRPTELRWGCERGHLSMDSAYSPRAGACVSTLSEWGGSWDGCLMLYISEPGLGNRSSASHTNL